MGVVQAQGDLAGFGLRALSRGASHLAPSPWVELGSTQRVWGCGVWGCGMWG